MADGRQVEDRLREEYFDVLPDIRRAVLETETRIRGDLLEISLNLQRYERLIVTSRVKECDSALDSLRRRQQYGRFDQNGTYSIRHLRDLAAVRVLVFPHQRLQEVELALRPSLVSWTTDPVTGTSDEEEPLALKYYGKWNKSSLVTAEIQIVPLLVGLFWEVEHSAMYKPNPNVHGAVRRESVIQRRNDVLAALSAFESEFEKAILEGQESSASDMSS
jgi:ppGpp synthetase/RelA/SpoT-type nucleotidyltranferase